MVQDAIQPNKVPRIFKKRELKTSTMLNSEQTSIPSKIKL